MNQISQEQFEQALKECASEPIHQIGHLQPHGAALVFDAQTPHRVRQVSANLADVLAWPAAEALDRPLLELLGDAAGDALENLMRNASRKGSATASLALRRAGAEEPLLAHLFTTGEAGQAWVLELEREDDVSAPAQLAPLHLQFQQNLLDFDADADLSRYLAEIVKLVRSLTGYDSVMVYRFNARWDGEVLAQDHAEFMPSYLGLHFPASDIPPQARRLYGLNLVRIVADVDAEPTPIVPARHPVTDEALDLTHSALRSLSPVHLQYLRNMGVAASMVISLMQDGQLWGLVACHHRRPKRVSMAMRESAIFISRLISTRLSGFAAIRQRSLMEQANALVSALVKSIPVHEEGQVLQELLPGLADLMGASGLIAVVEDELHVYGLTPQPAQVRELLTWLGTQARPGEVFACDELGQRFAPAQGYAALACGLLTTALGPDLRNLLIWLRPEKPRSVTWAGRYESGLTRSDTGELRLTPRKSFETWSETWRGRSEPWSRTEISLADSLSLSVPEALSRKHQNDSELIRFRRAYAVSEATVQQINKLAQSVPGVVFQFLVGADGRWTFLYVSDRLRELYELEPGEVCRDHSLLFDCVVPEHRQAHLESVQSASHTLTTWTHEHQIRTPGGALKWVRGHAHPEALADGSVLWHGILTDITERKDKEARLEQLTHSLRESQALYRLLIEDASDVVWRTDADLRVTYISPVDERLRGFPADEVVGRSVFDAFDAEGAALVQGLLAQARAADASQAPGAFSMEVRQRCKDGAYLWVEVFAKPERDDSGRLIGFHGISRETTQRRKLEDQVRQLALFDHLTQLPNRRMLSDRLDQTMAASKRTGRHAAVLMLDLDNFKPLNDIHGHALGDMLLIEVARRLQACIRESDTVARYGGDEFVVLLGELKADRLESATVALTVAEKVRDALSEIYRLPRRRDARPDDWVEHRCSASIGAAVFRGQECSHEEILKRADASMYQAKIAGRNAIRFHG